MAMGWLGDLVRPAVVSGLLAACAPSNSYVQPAGLTPQNAGTIVGSTMASGSGFTADTKVYLVGVDDKLTLTGPSGWDQQILAAPGPHKITIGVGQSMSLFRPEAFGFVDVMLTIEPGHAYTLKSGAPLRAMPINQTSSSWIEDDGHVVSEPVSVTVRRALYPIVVPVK